MACILILGIVTATVVQVQTIPAVDHLSSGSGGGGSVFNSSSSISVSNSISISGSGSGGGGNSEQLARAMLQALAVIAGACVGVLMSATSPLAAERVTQRQMPQAVTMVYSMLLVGVLSGPPLAGLLYEASGSMAAAFFVSGGIFVVAALVLNVNSEASEHVQRQPSTTTKKTETEAKAATTADAALVPEPVSSSLVDSDARP